MPKNKITTQGYFVRRLREYGYDVSRCYDRYAEKDARKWMVVINAKADSLMVTCCDAGEWPYRGMYELNDGGQKVPRNLYINTDSIEVMVEHLTKYNIPNRNGDLINISDERSRKRPARHSKEVETEKGG